MRDFEWPEQRVWVGESFSQFAEYLEKQDRLEFSKLYKTLRGYYGMELLAKLG